MKPILMFLHIPRTGGTTLHNIVDRQYRPPEIHIIGHDIVGDQQRLRNLAPSQRNALKIVFGHYCFGLHNALPEREPHYITFLRNPVDRVASLYAYTQALPNHYLYECAASKNLADFVSSGCTGTTDNGMVRQLCGLDRFTMSDGEQLAYNDTVIPFGGVGAMHLQQAQNNLAEFGFEIGFTEWFHPSLLQIARRWGWTIPHYMAANRSRRKTVDPLTESLILEHNEWDVRLYAWAWSRSERL